MNRIKLLRLLGNYIPKKRAELGDFNGYMAGNKVDEIKRILLCLDFDNSIYEEAKSFKPDMIITHHPFIYGTYQHVLNSEPLKKELVNSLLKDLETSIYSFHTAFDACDEGMNDTLLKKLGAKNIHPSKVEYILKYAELEKEMTIEELGNKLKTLFNLSYVHLIPNGKKMIKKVGLIGGGGASYFKVAEEEGADVFISGDISHHVRRDIILHKFNYLDLPHEVERIFMERMAEILNQIDPTIELKIIDHEKEMGTI